jgi:hypothetical protein
MQVAIKGVKGKIHRRILSMMALQEHVADNVLLDYVGEAHPYENNDVVVCEFLGTCAARQMPAGGSGWHATNTLLTVLPLQACPSRYRDMSSSVLCLPSNFFRSKRLLLRGLTLGMSALYLRVSDTAVRCRRW